MYCSKCGKAQIKDATVLWEGHQGVPRELLVADSGIVMALVVVRRDAGV